MQIQGEITTIGSVETGEKKTGGTWAKQTFVITEQAGQYPRSLAFEVWNDKIALSEGEVCTIHFNSEAREYNGRWFNNVTAWKKEGGKTALEQTNQPSQTATKPTGGTLAEQKPAAQSAKAAEEDDLPF